MNELITREEMDQLIRKYERQLRAKAFRKAPAGNEICTHLTKEYNADIVFQNTCLRLWVSALNGTFTKDDPFLPFAYNTMKWVIRDIWIQIQTQEAIVAEFYGQPIHLDAPRNWEN